MLTIEVVVCSNVTLDSIILRDVSNILHPIYTEGHNISNTFQYNALLHNNSTHLDLNNKLKVELLPP